MDEIRRALVTGPSGGVGRALLSVLSEAGTEVTAVLHPGSSRGREVIEKIPGVSILEWDLKEFRDPGKRPEGTFDAFFHLGWDGSRGADRLEPERQRKNVEYTLDAVRLAKDLGCKVFVGAGSQSEFGHVDGVMKPGLPCDPDNEYGKAKLQAGIESRELAKELGIRHEWLRILSSFGPGDAETTMVVGTLLAFLRGEDRKFTAGDQIWDYLYTKDVGRAFLAAAESGRDGSVYVVGSGKTRRLREFIEAMRDIVAPERKLTFGELPYYKNQVMRMEADISTLTADTGFTPKYSFEEGIRETAEWLRSQELPSDSSSR